MPASAQNGSHGLPKFVILLPAPSIPTPISVPPYWSAAILSLRCSAACRNRQPLHRNTQAVHTPTERTPQRNAFFSFLLAGLYLLAVVAPLSAQYMCQHNTCVSTIHESAQYMCQHNACVSTIHVSAQYMCQHDTCVSTIHVSAQYMCQHDTCVSTIHVSAQYMCTILRLRQLSSPGLTRSVSRAARECFPWLVLLGAPSVNITRTFLVEALPLIPLAP